MPLPRRYLLSFVHDPLPVYMAVYALCRKDETVATGDVHYYSGRCSIVNGAVLAGIDSCRCACKTFAEPAFREQARTKKGMTVVTPFLRQTMPLLSIL